MLKREELIEAIRIEQYDDIEKMYKDCVALKEEAEKEKDDYALCFSLIYMADYAFSSWDHNRALNIANEALEINEERGYDDLLVQAYNVYAINVCNDSYSLATGYYLKGLKLAKSLNDHVMILKYNVNLGDVFINLDQYERALPYCLSALKELDFIAVDHPAYALVRFVVIYLCMIYMPLKDYTKAIDLIRAHESDYLDDLTQPMTQIKESFKAFLLHKTGHEEESSQIVDKIMHTPVAGYRANESIFYIYNTLLDIAFDNKDENRANAIFKRLKENEFSQTGIKYNLDYIESRIQYCHIFQHQEKLCYYYDLYHQFSLEEKKHSKNFLLDSVLYKIEHMVQEEEQEKIKKLSFTDELTGLPNRRYFYDLFKLYKQRSHSIGVIIFDLDHFKEHNDNWGHLEGDAVLKAFGKSLDQNFPCIHPCRFGGDEFICIMEDVKEKEIIRYIEESFIRFDNQNFHDITISCGYYNILNSNIVSSDILIRYADQYLYNVKNHGRNGFKGYSDQ